MEQKKDILGRALRDHFNKENESGLYVLSEGFDEDEMDLAYYFRSYDEMPVIEQLALEACKGKCLEIGGGVGSHALYLKEKGLEVELVDNSDGCCEIMRARGLGSVHCMDYKDVDLQGFDTVYALMNGIGLAGSIEGLEAYLKKIFTFLKDGGQFIVDSSDLIYLYLNEDGSADIDLNADYYGEMKFRYKYKDELSEEFNWLYADEELLREYCNALGLQMEVLYREDYHFLARITRS